MHTNIGFLIPKQNLGIVLAHGNLCPMVPTCNFVHLVQSISKKQAGTTVENPLYIGAEGLGSEQFFLSQIAFQIRVGCG